MGWRGWRQRSPGYRSHMDFQTSATSAVPLAGLGQVSLPWQEPHLGSALVGSVAKGVASAAGRRGGEWTGRWGGRGGLQCLVLHLSQWVFLSGHLCCLLMNSLVSVFKRTACVLWCLRVAIRVFTVLLTNSRLVLLNTGIALIVFLVPYHTFIAEKKCFNATEDSRSTG